MIKNKTGQIYKKNNKRSKTSNDQMNRNDNRNNLNKQRKSSSKIKRQYIQASSQRYFKKVLNKDISPRKLFKAQNQNEQHSQLRQSIKSNNKNIVYINQVKSQLNPIQQKQNQSSTNNFSLGLFNKSQAPNQSFFKQIQQKQRNSRQRQLNYNKIFLFDHDQSPFKQVIQLSVRQLENRQMLQKAVHQLEKRKLKKKIKLLKKNMGIVDSPLRKPREDQLIDQLRSHQIGYKTFYKKQISTGRFQSDKSQKYSPSKQCFESPKNQKDIRNIKDQQKIKDSFINKELENQNYVILEDQEQLKKQNNPDDYLNVKISQVNKKRNSTSRIKQALNLKNKDIQKLNPYTLRLPHIKRQRKSTSIKKQSPQSQSTNLKCISQRALYTSLTYMKKFSTLIKKPQSFSLTMNQSKPHQKIIDQLNKFPIENQRHIQTNLSLVRQPSQNEQFPFLMTKEDLELTLNKSRYQVKKLMCMHIQKRKKEWRNIKKKMLLSDGNMLIQQESQNHITTQRQTQNKVSKQQNKQRNSLGYMSQRKLAAPLPPTHILKIHTRQLKKSIRSFVQKLNKNLSPKQKQNFKPIFN